MDLNNPIQLTPQAIAPPGRSARSYNLNYTNQDFWSLKDRLVGLIEEQFGDNGTALPGAFNDFVEGDLGIMLLETWAFIADTLSFKADQAVNELFIDTVGEVDNAFRLARLVGFRPLPPVSARSFWSATIPSPQTADVHLPSPVVVEMGVDGEPMSVELYQADAAGRPIFDTPIIIPAGSILNDKVVGLEGRTITEGYTGTGVPGQAILLARRPVAYGGIRVDVDGSAWAEVDYFTDSNPRREFRVEYDSDFGASLIFGNNRAGLSPSPGSQIRVRYRMGGGQKGNIVSGRGERLVQATIPGLPFAVPVSFRNYTRGEGGYDGDTLADIKRKLPAWVRTQDRCVSGSDYKTIAEQFASPVDGVVGKAQAVLRHSGAAANVVDIYILSRDGNDSLSTASADLHVALQAELDQKKMVTDHVCIRDGEVLYVQVNIDARLNPFQRKYEAEIKDRIDQAISDFFSLSRWDFGRPLRSMDLLKHLSEIRQVDAFDVSFVAPGSSGAEEIVDARVDQVIRPEQITVQLLFD